MPSVYKPSGRKTYRIEFKDQHGLTLKVAAFRDKRASEELGRKLETDALRLRVGQPPIYPDVTLPYLLGVSARGLTWAEFRQRFEDEHASGLRPSTRAKYRDVFNVFEEECQPRALREITEQTLSQFAARLRQRPVKKRGTPTGQIGLAPWTVKNYLVALHTALEWAATQKLLAAAPDRPVIRVPKKKPQPVSPADFNRLLAQATDPLWNAYLLCGWWAGLRLSEAHHLRRSPSAEWPWLDLAGNRIALPAVFAKSDEDQWVPLHSVLRKALEALPDTGDEVFPFRSRKGGRLSRSGITQQIMRFARRAGVELSMHTLRKGFGCRVAQQLGKGNAPVLHELMRHSSMQVTMDFYASVDDALQEAMRQLDAPAPASSTPTNDQGGGR